MSVLPGTDVVARTLARNRLTVPDVMFFDMSAAAPLTVVAGVVTTGFAVTGVTGSPLAFVVVAVVLAMFAQGFVAMGRHVANAGAFNAYIARGLGRVWGVGASLVALVAYNALVFGLYGAIGFMTAPLLEQWFGVGVAWWVVAVPAWALTAVLGGLRVDLNGRVLAVLVLAEIGLILVFSTASLLHPAGGRISTDTLEPANLLQPGAGALLVLAVLGFVGFENSVVFSEESRDPKRTIRIATFATIMLAGVIYTVSSWAMTVQVGPDQIIARSQADGPELLFVLATANLGTLAADIGHVLIATSVLAGMISFHNTTARYLFALGREGVLPAWLGRTSRSGAPIAGSLVQSGLGLIVIAVYAIAGWDPLVTLFFWWGTSGAIGVLLLLTATSIAVIVFFIRNRTTAARHSAATSVARRLFFPIPAAVGLIGIAHLAISDIDTLLGVPNDALLTRVVPGIYVAAAVVGIGWGLYLKHRRPIIYQRIGMGAKAATTGLNLTPPGLPGLPGQHPNPADHIAPKERSR
jgi:amino acid transporter